MRTARRSLTPDEPRDPRVRQPCARRARGEGGGPTSSARSSADADDATGLDDVPASRDAPAALPEAAILPSPQRRARAARICAMRSRTRRSDASDRAHGFPPTEKDAAMEALPLRRQAQVLVATTVVEVGVDVPNACRHGRPRRRPLRALATLHQLRGRVGRGEHRRPRCYLSCRRPARRRPPWPSLSAHRERTDGRPSRSRSYDLSSCAAKGDSPRQPPVAAASQLRVSRPWSATARSIECGPRRRRGASARRPDPVPSVASGPRARDRPDVRPGP